MPVITVQAQSATGMHEFANSETAVQSPRSSRFSTKLTPDLRCWGERTESLATVACLTFAKGDPGLTFMAFFYSLLHLAEVAQQEMNDCANAQIWLCQIEYRCSYHCNSFTKYIIYIAVLILDNSLYFLITLKRWPQLSNTLHWERLLKRLVGISLTPALFSPRDPDS